jgi:hypothetical protein
MRVHDVAICITLKADKEVIGHQLRYWTVVMILDTTEDIKLLLLLTYLFTHSLHGVEAFLRS